MEAERNYKDRLYRLLFTKDKKNLLSLYNALNHTNYTNEQELEINTLENAVYMNMKNDISFVFDFSLNLYEQQSTYNPNMPLRNLFYLSKVLQGMVTEKNLYGSTLVKIPAPRFVVFYNGVQKQPEQKIMYLSDAFEKRMDNPEVELRVTMININLGSNSQLLEECKLLKEYAQYVEKVRRYARKFPIREAVNLAVDESIREGILVEFLTQYRAEAIEVSIFEYDEEVHMSFVRAEGIEQGRCEGEVIKLISQVQKKLLRGNSVMEIADMLEESETIISELAELINENSQRTAEELLQLYLGNEVY